jgi:hypothetical protein
MSKAEWDYRGNIRNEANVVQTFRNFRPFTGLAWKDSDAGIDLRWVDKKAKNRKTNVTMAAVDDILFGVIFSQPVESDAGSDALMAADANYLLVFLSRP